MNWQKRYVEVYRREEATLKLYNTLYEKDTLESPLLPGFIQKVSQIFADIV